MLDLENNQENKYNHKLTNSPWKMEKVHMTTKSPHPENPLFSILFNILLPVFILNNLTTKWGDRGPLYALLLALSFPIVYGLMDYLKRKKKNFLSLLGIINTVSTGGLALMQLKGIWFAVKEAIFPLLLGLGVFYTVYTKKPFIKTISYNFLNMPLIDQHTQTPNQQNQLYTLFKNSTLIFALSFLISSLLNFLLALWVFQDIDPQLTETEKAAILNSQVSKMTWMGYVVIALPLTVLMFLNIWYIARGLMRITHLPLSQCLKDPHQ